MCKTYVAQTHWICSSLTSELDCNIEESKLTWLPSATSLAVPFPSAQQYQKALHQNQLSQLSTDPLICGDTGIERCERGQKDMHQHWTTAVNSNYYFYFLCACHLALF